MYPPCLRSQARNQSRFLSSIPFAHGTNTQGDVGFSQCPGHEGVPLVFAQSAHMNRLLMSLHPDVTEQ